MLCANIFNVRFFALVLPSGLPTVAPTLLSSATETKKKLRLICIKFIKSDLCGGYSFLKICHVKPVPGSLCTILYVFFSGRVKSHTFSSMPLKSFHTSSHLSHFICHLHSFLVSLVFPPFFSQLPYFTFCPLPLLFL